MEFVRTREMEGMWVLTISTALDVPKRIFAVLGLYVSVMGLTRCYKTTVFYIYRSLGRTKTSAYYWF